MKAEKISLNIAGLVKKEISRIMRKYDFKNRSDTIRYIILKNRENERREEVFFKKLQ